ncbi:hypothetical protein BJ170DRAFT_683806 [Xylariales sp. AK1849]|nr:hypothetical protein BJ170DRAFT_683806 [Xylariales sp. AK1849]
MAIIAEPRLVPPSLSPQTANGVIRPKLSTGLHYLQTEDTLSSDADEQTNAPTHHLVLRQCTQGMSQGSDRRGSPVRRMVKKRRSIPRLGDLSTIKLELISQGDLTQSDRPRTKHRAHHRRVSSPSTPITEPVSLPGNANISDFISGSASSNLSCTSQDSIGVRYITPESSPPTPCVSSHSKENLVESSQDKQAYGIECRNAFRGYYRVENSTKPSTQGSSCSHRIGGTSHRSAIRSPTPLRRSSIEKVALALCMQAAASADTPSTSYRPSGSNVGASMSYNTQDSYHSQQQPMISSRFALYGADRDIQESLSENLFQSNPALGRATSPHNSFHQSDITTALDLNSTFHPSSSHTLANLAPICTTTESQAWATPSVKVNPVRTSSSPDIDDQNGASLKPGIGVPKAAYDDTLFLKPMQKESRSTEHDKRLRAQFREQVFSKFDGHKTTRTAAATTAAIEVAAESICPEKREKFIKLKKKLVLKGLLGSSGSIDDRDVYVFVDMSNICIGYQDIAKIRQGFKTTSRGVKHLPMCFEHLNFIFERGRSIEQKHMAGSVKHPGQQIQKPRQFLEAEACGYVPKLLERVHKIDKHHYARKSAKTNGMPTWITTSGDDSSDELSSPVLCPRTKLGEQGVDETIHLRMTTALLEAKRPGVMVLATGDAQPAEYSEGFAHFAIMALERGWDVEIISWKPCLSGEWKKSPFCDKYAKQVRIIELDEFFDQIQATWRPS